jgi:hypothetical protein
LSRTKKALGKRVTHKKSQVPAAYRRLPFLRSFYKRGRPKDPDGINRFVKIAALWNKKKNWEQIAEAFKPDYVTADACKKHFRRYLPEYLKWYRNRFAPAISEQDFLASILSQTKRKAGRPKSGQK